jgi:site-specific DNA-methyltransferase (adenine-specific)
MPLRNTEDICIFGKGTYNPQKTDGHIPTQSAIGASNGVLYHGKNKRNYVGGDTTRFPTTLLEFDAHDPKNRQHPTQKPVPLCEYLIKTYTNAGEWVLDNTMGSGTTGVACMNTGRNFIGIKRDDKYFEIAKARITEASEKVVANGDPF